MALSVPELDLVLGEVAPRLVGARLQEIRVPALDRVVLSFRAPGDTCHLMLVVQSEHARLHPVERPPPNPRPALAVQGALRATLRGACTALARDPGERVVRARIGEHTLLAELTGRHGNLFILDGGGAIEIALLANRSHRRDLRAGLPYVPPASQPPRPRPARFEPPGVGAQVCRFYEDRERQDELEGLRGRALRQLRTLRKRVARKARRQRAETDRGDDVDALRREADLLNANFHALRQGMGAVEVDDWFEEGAPRRTIRLDPARAPREEVDRRYRSARRLERGARRAAEELARTEEELERLEQALRRVEQAADAAALAEVVRALPRRWRPQEAPRRRRRAERAPFHTYRLPDGGRIWVGRSARDNDELTFRQARGNDVWLHVVGGAGAHVVVPLEGDGPEPRVLAWAAQLALAHAGLDEGDDAEVAWTRVKYVRKVKGVPGKVTYSQERVMRMRRERAKLQGVEREDR